MKKIDFNVPCCTNNGLLYIEQAIKNHKICGDGVFTKKCNEWMEKKFNAKKVLLTTSGTSALEVAALLCDVKPGDEVIMPSYSMECYKNNVHRKFKNKRGFSLA